MSGIQDIASRIAQIQQLVQPRTTQNVNTKIPADAAAISPTDVSSSQFKDALNAAQTESLSARASAGGAVSGQAVVADAKKYIGTPYVWGGTNPSTGLDCSGLVQRVYKDLGIELPRVSRDQAKAGTAVPSLDQAKPGDLVAFGSPVHHIGIYVGDGKMLHAPQPGEKVKIGPVYETPSAIRRIIPDGGASGVAATAGASAVGTSGSLRGIPYANLFTQAGQKYGIRPELLAAVAKVESGYSPTARSGAGAQGLMQLMPGTAAGLGVNALDPAQAIDGAARLLKSHLKSFGSLPLALAAYNAGPGAVKKYHGIPPYAETQSYVVKVQSAMNALTSGAAA